jgi:hypothetical protein
LPGPCLTLPVLAGPCRRFGLSMEEIHAGRVITGIPGHARRGDHSRARAESPRGGIIPPRFLPGGAGEGLSLQSGGKRTGTRQRARGEGHLGGRRAPGPRLAGRGPEEYTRAVHLYREAHQSSTWASARWARAGSTPKQHIYIEKHTRAAVGHLGLGSLGVGADRLPAASAARHGRDVTAKG